MTEFTGKDEIQDRLNWIESMVLEGRRGTQSWGWAFLLWGIAYLVAFGWSAVSSFAWIWPITMVAAALLTVGIVRWKGVGHAQTTASRAIGAIWAAMGISAFLLFMTLSLSGRLTDEHVFFATLAAILGLVNGASAMILRWRAQFACALVWWAAAVVSCYEAPMAFLAALFLCQIVFGVYLMYVEGRRPRVQAQRMQSHA